jgi:hypothetical protein
VAADRGGWRSHLALAGATAADTLGIVVGLAVGLAVGLVIGLVTGGPAALAVAAVLAAALLAVLAAAVVGLLRDRRRARRAQDLYARLVTAAEVAPWLPDAVDRITDAALDTERRLAGTAGSRLGRTAVDTCLDTLTRIRAGRFETPLATEWLTLALAEQTRESLLAATVDLPGPTRWLSPTGRPYAGLGLLALQRGAAVQQIFVYRKWTGRHERALREHHRQGIRTLRVQADQLPRHLRADLTIWDGWCAARAWMTADGGGWRGEYLFSADQVAGAMEDYRTIVAAAETWPAGQDDTTAS